MFCGTYPGTIRAVTLHRPILAADACPTTARPGPRNVAGRRLSARGGQTAPVAVARDDRAVVAASRGAVCRELPSVTVAPGA
ncbi:hypothetical protein Psuf_005240 [Phytohabitans suffuscus]|uniref:Uncharacterized protein n=1 Tax=Phytohabitans suffuscus TaxID=624315 RepID=A0A6F8YB77_9ACTN|nr:hypothetical protein Psuf_005240 [Phytohabitans suffuscus]